MRKSVDMGDKWMDQIGASKLLSSVEEHCPPTPDMSLAVAACFQQALTKEHKMNPIARLFRNRSPVARLALTVVLALALFGAAQLLPFIGGVTHAPQAVAGGDSFILVYDLQERPDESGATILDQWKADVARANRVAPDDVRTTLKLDSPEGRPMTAQIGLYGVDLSQARDLAERLKAVPQLQQAKIIPGQAASGFLLTCPVQGKPDKSHDVDAIMETWQAETARAMRRRPEQIRISPRLSGESGESTTVEIAVFGVDAAQAQDLARRLAAVPQLQQAQIVPVSSYVLGQDEADARGELTISEFDHAFIFPRGTPGGSMEQAIRDHLIETRGSCDYDIAVHVDWQTEGTTVKVRIEPK